MSPLSRAIWLLARWGAEAEKNEAASVLADPMATAVEQEQTSDTVPPSIPDSPPVSTRTTPEVAR